MKVRASTVDGIFYPAEREELAALVRRLLAGAAGAQGAGTEPACCVISPHAAYDYSGAVSAAAFQAAAGRAVERVVLLGPVHREPADRLFLPESAAFQSPLGEVEVDGEAVRTLAGFDPAFALDDIPHLEEHCLEVQLPFVQIVFPQARIVPVLMGRPSPALVNVLASSLRKVFTPFLNRSLVVVSANMTSYRPREQGAVELEAVLELIRSGDWQALVDRSARKSISSCGAGCIAAILSLEKQVGARANILKTASSLELNGDERKVVHYAAIAFERTNHGTNPDGRGAGGPAADRAGGG